MIKIFRLSFSLKNTYRVNTILYSLKQIPLLKKILPQALYGVKGFKIFANILSGIWELVTIFVGKIVYVYLMIFLMSQMYQTQLEDTYLYIFFVLTIIGSYTNTFMFNPSKDKYYAMILMRMDAKMHTLVNYFYSILKVIVGFVPVSIYFGLKIGISLWLCILIPFFVASLKLFVATIYLIQYEKTGNVTNENRLSKFLWISIFGLLLVAYGLPYINFVLNKYIVIGTMVISILIGVISIKKILSFDSYYTMVKQIVSDPMLQTNNTTKIVFEQSLKNISADASITSNKKGFEFLNEIFIKRHQKILWKSSKNTAVVSACIIGIVLVVINVVPEIKDKTNDIILVYLPYFVFIMYLINKGTGFTSALFMHCDHSLLTYSFYKRPDYILKLFQIRCREIIKINLLPAIVIGSGLVIILYVGGGTSDWMNYVVLFVSILCMSVFFSIHYLTIYYLLQPYNAGTEVKSGTYQVIVSITYFICYMMIRIQMPILLFGTACIIFCILYSIIACVLVYRMAPKTFKIRS